MARFSNENGNKLVNYSKEEAERRRLERINERKNQHEDEDEDESEESLEQETNENEQEKPETEPNQDNENIIEEEQNGIESVPKKQNNLVNSAKTAAKNAGKKAAKAVGAAAKKAGAALVKFLAANPVVLVIIGVVILLIIIILAFAASDSENKNGYYDRACDFNLTNVKVNENDSMSVEEFVLGATNALIKGKDYKDEAIKAIMIVEKTNALSYGAYSSDSKSVDISSRAITVDSNYEDKGKLESLYEQIKDYLYINKDYKDKITSLKESDAIPMNSGIAEEMNSLSSSYSSILDNIYSRASSYSNNSSFWWPIGSSEVGDDGTYKGTPSSTLINSRYGERADNHQGLDIGVLGDRCGEDVVIASKSGTVVDVFNGCSVNQGNSSSYSCGDPGWGNYVKIQHDDTHYTLYGHLYPGSITVSVGDTVTQGQMIGKVGTTGPSSGCHLHFEVYNGGSATSYRVNPEGYVSAGDPRPVAEGTTVTSKTVENNRRVYNLGDYCEFIETDGNVGQGLNGYPYFHIDNVCENVTVNGYGTYPLEDYIAGVIYGEAGVFDNDELFKTFAIAARTFFLRNSSSCTVESSESFQVFKDITNQSGSTIEKAKRAAQDTKGLVLVRDNSLVSTMYDAFCWETKDSENYTLCQKNYDTGEHLKVPVSWANEYVAAFSGQVFLDNSWYGAHGQGMSADGAYYMGTQLGMNFKEILSYFYGSSSTIMSIYQGVGYNYTQTTSSGFNNILEKPLGNFLKDNNTSVCNYNEFILSEVLKAGYGTREAVVASAVALVGNLYNQYNVRIPYTMCGQHYCENIYAKGTTNNLNRSATSFYGIDPNWGSNLNPYIYSNEFMPYSKYGPDCSGFVSWAIYNAGFNSSIHIADQEDLGKQTRLNGKVVAQPGDLMYHPGHIMLIIGVDEKNQLYYIAQAAGGEDGVKISTKSFSDSSEIAVDMTDWYSKNKLSISESEFIARYRNGYVDGDKSCVR